MVSIPAFNFHSLISYLSLQTTGGLRCDQMLYITIVIRIDHLWPIIACTKVGSKVIHPLTVETHYFSVALMWWTNRPLCVSQPGLATLICLRVWECSLIKLNYHFFFSPCPLLGSVQTWFLWIRIYFSYPVKWVRLWWSENVTQTLPQWNLTS